MAAPDELAIKAQLVAVLSDSEWQSAEAWSGDDLACRVDLSMLADHGPSRSQS